MSQGESLQGGGTNGADSLRQGAEPGAERSGLTRRALLRDGGAIGFAVIVAAPASGLADVAVPLGAGRARFLREAELRALRGVVDRLIPGRPEDSVDGALAGRCAEAIDALLGAFSVKPPRIYAGAPFSDRAGSPVNHFRRFLRLDRYEEKAWKLRIRGSRGRKRLEFNGPVKGWQAIYREGLAALNQAASPRNFGDLTFAERELILRGSSDRRVAELIDVAFPHTLQLMYGAPEYGGNRDLLGWRYTRYDGDVQPRGWTRREVEEHTPRSYPRRYGDPGTAHLGDALRAVLPVAALASPEAGYSLVARSGDSLAKLRAEIEAITEWAGSDAGRP